MLDRLTGLLAGEAAADLVPRYIGFNVPFSPVLCILALIVAGVAVGVYYWRKLLGLPQATRIFLVALRVAIVVLALFLAMDPSVVAQHVRPGEQFVALLFDDSMSMRIGGLDGASRGERLQGAYAAASESFEARLKRRHQIVQYRVGQGAEPLKAVDDLTFDQRQSDLTGAVSRAITDLEGAAVSAVVLFSDGIQRSESDAPLLVDLPPDVPVFTVGVDEESAWRDIELSRLSIKRTDFDRSPVVLTAGIHATGLAGRQAVVEVGIGSRTIKSKLIDITDDLQDNEVRLEFVPDRKDWIEYEARVRIVEDVAPADDPFSIDRIAENNVRRFAVDNRDHAYRILYVSGRPNWQNKFFRIALEDDDQLDLTSLLAISNAEQKFVFRGKKSTMSNPLFEGFDDDRDRPRYDEAVYLRLGAAQDELVTGYPATSEELFGYDLVIWGDVEREFFTTEQLELTRDFVDKRGGTLLLLGGPNGFTEGRYAGTLVERMLPVVLFQDTQDGGDQRLREPFTVIPTMEGRLAGSWMFSTDENEDSRLWSEMPPLYGLNKFPLVRAGASVMAEAESSKGPVDGRPLFAIQRYGEGKTAVLASGDTWQWKMRADHQDDNHERFWRQLVRNLVADTPEPVLLRGKEDRYTRDDITTFDFIVRDPAFDRREALQCVVAITTPSGKTFNLPVEESIQEEGLYHCEYIAEEPGLCKISLTAIDDEGRTVAQLDETVLIEEDSGEFQNAQYNGAFMRDLAKTTGGAHYTLYGLADLAEAIPVPARLDSEDVLLHLWYLPIFFIALVAMMIIEWYVRRKAGRA